MILDESIWLVNTSIGPNRTIIAASTKRAPRKISLIVFQVLLDVATTIMKNDYEISYTSM